MTQTTCLLLALCALALPAGAENLSRDAAYSVVVSGFVYRGQILPGTNTPAAVDGFADAPAWEGPRDALTDGRREGASVASWFWSQMDKRITATFDLRRPCRLAAVRAWPATGGFDSVTARVAASREALAGAAPVALSPEGEGFAWRGAPVEGRFVLLTCTSKAPQMTLAEVEIEGDALGAVAADAPAPGLLPVPRRDLAALIRLPERPEGVANVAARAETRVTVTSRHYDDKTGAWTDDTVARDSDPTGRAGGASNAAVLVDGSPRTAVRSFSGWYGAKTITAELDLGKAWQVERVVVWSAGHEGPARCYLNAFRVWVQAGPGGAWTPAGETRNPVLPGEKTAPEVPIASGVIGRPARAVRVEMQGAGQSADLVQAGEIEVWAKPLQGAVTAKPFRVKVPVPAIAPVKPGKIAPALAWIRRERIRALYTYVWQWKNTALLDHAAKAGFNTLLVHTMGATHSEEGWPKEAAEWVRIQRERKMRVLVSWPYGSDERYGNTQFGAYQPGGPVRWKRTPCPLAREYWERVVGDRARLAARAGLAGMVVDMEMYSADSTRHPGPCYCDTCFSRFVAGHLEGVDAAAISLDDRPAWIAGNRLAADYARWQEIAVAAILKGIEKSVHAISPAFLLGNLLDAESLPGLARGFGTPTVPALIFSELEYHGNLAGTPGRLALLREGGYPALYVPGLWIQPVTPPRLPALAVDAAVPSAGYWIWSSAAFADDLGGEYAHAKGYSHDDYWQAFRASHDALDQALRSGAGTHAPPAAKVPQLAVPRVARAPKSDADWAGAAAFPAFTQNATGAPARAATRASALWDGTRLYLRVLCDEPEPGKSPALRGGHDDATLWQQDSIEVFWMRPGSARYAHVIASAAGTVSDSLAEGLRGEDPGWNADVRVEARRSEKGWELRLSLPLAVDGAGALKPGSRLRFEIARNRPGAGETTSWAPTRGMFKAAPNLWGVLVLR